METYGSAAFVASNLAITLAYFFLAAVVVPRITIKLNRTRFGGIGFFMLCGLHHLDNVFHLLFAAQSTILDVYVSWHMLLIDVPQAFCVWLFVTGLYTELVRWGPWGVDPGLEDHDGRPAQ